MRTANYFIRKYKKEAKDWRALAVQATSDESRELRLHFAKELEKDAQTIEQMMVAKKMREALPGCRLFTNDSPNREPQENTDEPDT